MLRFVEGMTGPEIAARTGLTPGSVRVNLHRGMQALARRARQEPCGMNDYLWDRGGDADEETRRLEESAGSVPLPRPLAPLRGERVARSAG